MEIPSINIEQLRKVSFPTYYVVEVENSKELTCQKKYGLEHCLCRSSLDGTKRKKRNTEQYFEHHARIKRERQARRSQEPG
jgi:hypothetical protein